MIRKLIRERMIILVTCWNHLGCYLYITKTIILDAVMISLIDEGEGVVRISKVIYIQATVANEKEKNLLYYINLYVKIYYVISRVWKHI